MKIFSHNGWKSFFLIWSGQSVSLIGTGMSRFGLLIWAYQQTGLATTTALLGFFNYFTMIATTPLAGLAADRFKRKYIMLAADSLAACMSAMVLILLRSGQLEIWHLYLVMAVCGICDTFQYTALQTSISLMLPSDQFTRASSLNGLADNSSRVLSPVLAGMLLPLVGMQALLWIDLVTFGASLLSLALAWIPQPAAAPIKITSFRESLDNYRVGWKFIYERKGLLGLTFVYSFINLFAGLTYYSIITAMILARTGQNAGSLSLVESALGLGGIVGGLILTAWGGPKKKVRAIMVTTAISFIIGDGLFSAGRSVPVWMAAGFLSNLFVPFISAPNQAIWQQKVPSEMQGRVFSLRSTLQMITVPIGYLLAGPLADRVFEPAMQAGGSLAGTFGWLTGVGPGAGMGLMFAFTAIGGMLTGVIGYSIRSVRLLETELPDQLHLTSEAVKESSL